MGIRYELWSTVRGGDPYDPASIYPSSSETIKVKQFSEFSLRLSYRNRVYQSPEPSTWDFKYCKMHGLLPDGTTFMTEDYPTVGSNVFPYGSTISLSQQYVIDSQKQYYVDIPFDERFSSQIGSTKYSVIFMDENKSVVASMQFQITVEDPAVKGMISRTYDLDFCPKDPPIVIKLSQDNTSFQFIFRVKTKYGTLGSSRFITNNTYLRGVLPNGEPLDVKVSATSSNYYNEGIVYTITLDGRTDAIGALMTSAPGEYLAAFSFCDNTTKHAEQITMQRIKFIIEPKV